MLHLHCGWQRTGTSSLQAALSAGQQQLATVGIVYPDEWRPRGSDAHYGLGGSEAPDGAGGEAAPDLSKYLASQAGRTVLISNEALSNLLVAGRRQELVGLVRSAQEAMPVTCIWTLRAMDSLLTSLYLHRIATARPLPPPDAFFADFARQMADGIVTMAEVGEVLRGNVCYVRYERSGAHHEEILRSVGVPAATREELLALPRTSHRLNAQLGQKGAAALLHPGEIENRLGLSLSVESLRRALRSGQLRFAGDRPCELVAPELRREVHEAALRASRQVGSVPYAELFADHDVGATPAVPLTPDVLDEDDLRQLRAYSGLR